MLLSFSKYLFTPLKTLKLPRAQPRISFHSSSNNMDSLRNKMSALTPYQRKHKVTVVGSGNWGSTIAKVVAENTATHPDLFEKDVQMWVYEEEMTLSKDSKHYDESSELSTKPQKLTHLINHFHENVKYLPGIPLPHNIIANPSITDSVKDSTILIFNLPHQFIEGLCKQLRGHILPYARGISCIKGVNVKESSISLFSETIGRELDIYCGALSGANIANEVAQEKFCETTIAYDPPPIDSQNPTPATSAGPSPASSHVDLTQLAHKEASGKTSKIKLKQMPQEYHPIDQSTFKTLFHRRYFHVRVVSDVAGVSLGGALKNIVAIAAGFVDGLKWGDNAKAAVMRVGLLEMVDFGKRFFEKTVNTATFTEESCGVADLITTCAGGRNHRCAKLSVERGVPIEEVEATELNGQKIQGTLTAVEVNRFLKSRGLEKEYPLFTAVYNILKGNAKVEDLPDLIEPSDESRSKPPNPTPTVTSATSPTTTIDQPTSITPALPSLEATRTHPPPPSTKPSILTPPHPLTTSRYHRQALLPSISIRGQSLLAQSKILIIGLGGLGSPASIYLVAMGIHTLGLVDGDTVELSNLHRQVVHREATVGKSKVDSAIEGLKALNSEVEYVGYKSRLTPENVQGIMEGYDIVLDCTDNPATRYLISDACVLAGKVLVSGAAQRTEGQLMVLNYPTEAQAEKLGAKMGPCYRCVFPVPPPPETVQSCEEVGVLGPVVGVIGVLMAMEVAKIVVATDEERKAWKPNLLLYSGMSKDPRAIWRMVGLRGRRVDCVSCADEGVVKEKGKEKISWEGLREGKVDYEDFCGRLEDVRVLGQENRIGARQFLDLMHGVEVGRKEPLVIDIREEAEYALGAKVKGSINVPISKILRYGNSRPSGDQSNAAKDEFEQLLGHGKQLNDDEPIYFVCQRGNDSQIAAKQFLDIRSRNGRNGWLGDITGGFQALQKEANT